MATNNILFSIDAYLEAQKKTWKRKAGQGKMKRLPEEELSTRDARVLYAYLCDDPQDHQFGMVNGAFEALGDKFTFRFRVHRPDFCGPHISNRMEDHYIVELNEVSGGRIATAMSTTWGSDAYLMGMSTDTEEGRILRGLVHSLQAYSRREKLCQKLRRMDKRHLAWSREQFRKYE